METLRLRLDGLRKAKHTTIVKREREPALVPISPKLGQRGLLFAGGGEGRREERGREERRHYIESFMSSCSSTPSLQGFPPSYNYMDFPPPITTWISPSYNYRDSPPPITTGISPLL